MQRSRCVTGTKRRRSKLTSEGRTTDSSRNAVLDSRIIFRDPEDRSKTAGWLWAVKHGFSHIDRVTEKDATTILDKLGVTPDEEQYHDAHDAMVCFRYPWIWLEKYHSAGGDMDKLLVKSKF